MAKNNQRRKNKILKLAVVFTFSAVIFGASTYAWFIGQRTVNVNPFEVEVAATDSLQLSLNGVDWSDTVSINSSNYSTTYEGNTNNWAGRGLIPVSTVGEIDPLTNRLKLFEKGSLTATKGGYRLMASQVPNQDPNSAPDGYVVFDLFIKNSSGTEYYADYDELNEEAIYLSNDSAVTVGSTGVANTGIENSVRVAFAQIGRVVATNKDAATIQGISCNGEAGTTKGDVTSICRTAQIWEPNDTDHVEDALTFYNTTCQKRIGESTANRASYEGSCGTVVDGLAYPTYAIKKAITDSSLVDVYDGEAYNGYTANTIGENASLFAFPYFTDTDKLKTGTERPTFITLAPNSITKVRVYIYIEGQDVDNYDFASIGKQISVKFGFTKERFTEDDIDYKGPVLNEGEGPDDNSAEHEEQVKKDKTKPVIKLSDNARKTTIAVGEEFTRPTVTSVTDNVSTLAPEDVKITGTVNTNVAGTYRVKYEVADEAGNLATETYTVIVK